MKQLLAFRGLAHDPQRVLAAVYRFASMGIKLPLNIGVGIQNTGLELSVAAFANAYDGERNFLHDPQMPFCHDASLAHLARGA